MLSDRVLLLVFQLTLFASIKRVYGLESLGQWATLSNIAQLLLSFFLLGIDVVVVKRIIDHPQDASKEIGSTLLIQSIGIFIFSIVMYGIVEAYYSYISNAYILLLIIIISNAFSLFAKVIFLHYSALVESRYRAFTIIMSAAISYIFLWVCIMNEWYIYYSLAFYYIVQSCIALFIYAFLFKQAVKWRADKKVIKYYLSIGSKLLVSTVSVSLFAQCDVILIEKISGATDAGAYSAALRISAIWFMCAGIIANAFFPKIVQLSHKHNAGSFEFLEWMCGVIVIISCLVALLTSIFAPYIMSIIYGEGMLLSAQILIIHIWTGIFIFLGAFSSKWLYATNQIKFDIYKTLFAAVINVFFNLLIIPSSGAKGAAFVSLFTYFIANFLFFFFVKELRSMFMLQLKSFAYILKPAKLFSDYKKVKCLFQ